MGGRRTWVAAAVLLLLGSLAGAGAVREHWLPCRGSMLSGSLLHGYAYGADFSDACLQTMDDGFSFLWPGTVGRWGAESLYGVACALLLALAWTVVVVRSPWSRTTRVLALLPALATAVAGAVSLLGGRDDTLDSAFLWLLVATDLLALLALVAVGVREAVGVRGLWQVGLALAASTAVGLFPAWADHVLMATTSDANWDTPPGAGYPTVVATALLAVALLVVTLAPARAPASSVVEPATA